MDRVRAYIRENPTASKKECAEACSCSISAVAIARRELGRQQLAAASATTGPQPKVAPIEKIVADVEKGLGHAWSPAKQAQFLSGMMADPAVPYQTRVAAANSLRELQRQTGGQGDLGPGVPVTLHEVRARLADLLEGVGRDLAKLAWREAFVARPRRGIQCAPSPPETNGSGEPSAPCAPTSGDEVTPSPSPSPSAAPPAPLDGEAIALGPPAEFVPLSSLLGIVPPEEPF